PVATAHALPHAGTAVDTLLVHAQGAERGGSEAIHRYTSNELATIELFDRLATSGATGISGALRASVVRPSRYALAATLVPDAPVSTLVDPRNGAEHSLITLVPFAAKGGRASMDGYRLGFWPAERGSISAGELPDGFIKVTEQNQHTRVSDNFT